MPQPISDKQIAERLGVRDLPETLRSAELGRRFVVDADSGAKSALSRLLVEGIHQGETVFRVQDWDIWPSSGLMPLFDRVRSSSNFPHSISDQPAELVDKSEVSYLECLVACALYFVWEFQIISLSEPLIIHVSHDEWLSVSSNERSVQSRVCEALTLWGAKEIFPGR